MEKRRWCLNTHHYHHLPQNCLQDRHHRCLSTQIRLLEKRHCRLNIHHHLCPRLRSLEYCLSLYLKILNIDLMGQSRKRVHYNPIAHHCHHLDLHCFQYRLRLCLPILLDLEERRLLYLYSVVIIVCVYAVWNSISICI